MDPAATEMFEEAKEKGKEGCYYFWKSDIMKTREQMVEYWMSLIDKYPIISLEDGFAEEDWEGWKLMTDAVGKRCSSWATICSLPIRSA